MENKMPLFGKINCRNLWKIVYHSHERGKRGCSIDIILELSEVFGVSTDYLLTGKKAGDESIRDSVENIMDELSYILARIDGKLA